MLLAQADIFTAALLLVAVTLVLGVPVSLGLTVLSR